MRASSSGDCPQLPIHLQSQCADPLMVHFIYNTRVDMTGKVPVPLRGQDVTGKEKALRKLTDREDEGQLLS